MVPTTSEAQTWLARWDRQQERYIADREDRFAVVCDVVAEAVGRPDPLVVDLGAGPGSLSVRLLDRLPEAEVVAVDADALLLGLARTAHGSRRGLRIVQHDLRVPGWADALGLARPVDAVVSTTALHWLTGAELAQVYLDAGTLLRPGGVLVNGDHLSEPADRPTVDGLARAVRLGRAGRVGVLDNEDWVSWWDAVGAADELAELYSARLPRPVLHDVPQPVGSWAVGPWKCRCQGSPSWRCSTGVGRYLSSSALTCVAACAISPLSIAVKTGAAAPARSVRSAQSRRVSAGPRSRLRLSTSARSRASSAPVGTEYGLPCR
jgi:SAM-dependent methyltransferase